MPPPRGENMTHRRRLLLLPCAAFLLLAAAALADDRHVLGEPGYIVLAGAADSTEAYVWQDGPGADRRSLVWDEGMVTMPDGREYEHTIVSSPTKPLIVTTTGCGPGPLGRVSVPASSTPSEPPGNATSSMW